MITTKNLERLKALRQGRKLGPLLEDPELAAVILDALEVAGGFTLEQWAERFRELERLTVRDVIERAKVQVRS